MLTFGHVHDLVCDALHSHFIQDAVMENANERTRVARILVQLDRHMGACVSWARLDVDSEYSRIGAGLTNKELARRREAYLPHGCEYDNDSISPISYRFFSVGSLYETAFTSGQARWDAQSVPGYFSEHSSSWDPEINVTDGVYGGGYYALALLSGSCPCGAQRPLGNHRTSPTQPRSVPLWIGARRFRRCIQTMRTSPLHRRQSGQRSAPRRSNLRMPLTE